MKYIFILVFSLYFNQVVATDRLIKDILPKGAMYNKNSAAIIKDQSGGFLTGGSVLIRAPAPKEINPLIIQTPKFSFDPCTGSGDFRFGGFSFISSKEMLDFFKRTTQASGFYAIKMLIKQNCPMCETIMSEFERIAREVSQFSLDQCTMAQNIAGGMLAKLNVGDKQRCMMQDNIINRSKDLAASTKACTDNPDGNKDAGKDEMDSLLGNEFNLVWKALKKGNNPDTEFAEMIMSISGTIIGERKDGKWHFNRKDSLFKDSKQIAHLIGSFTDQNVNVYKCDDTNKCLSPKSVNLTLGDQTLYRHIGKIVTSLTNKIALNTETEKLTDDEKALINFSTIPIINLIEQDLIVKGGRSDPLMGSSEIIELICYDMIIDFLAQLANIASNELGKLALGSNESDLIKNFNQDLERVKQTLHEHKMTAYQRVSTVMQVKENFKLQQEQINLRFSRILSTHIKE
jgi:hypothetical protein